MNEKNIINVCLQYVRLFIALISHIQSKKKQWFFSLLNYKELYWIFLPLNVFERTAYCSLQNFQWKILNPSNDSIQTFSHKLDRSSALLTYTVWRDLYILFKFYFERHKFFLHSDIRLTRFFRSWTIFNCKQFCDLVMTFWWITVLYVHCELEQRLTRNTHSILFLIFSKSVSSKILNVEGRNILKIFKDGFQNMSAAVDIDVVMKNVNDVKKWRSFWANCAFNFTRILWLSKSWRDMMTKIWLRSRMDRLMLHRLDNSKISYC